MELAEQDRQHLATCPRGVTACIRCVQLAYPVTDDSTQAERQERRHAWRTAIQGIERQRILQERAATK